VEDESFQRMADRNRAVVSWGARERGGSATATNFSSFSNSEQRSNSL
jgi:hypothetical protein